MDFCEGDCYECAHPMIHATIEGQRVELSPELVEKYNRPGPRYTSYPTAPTWSENFSSADYQKQLETSNTKHLPLSLYFHIPFCEERCTFCACSVVATKKHAVAEPYLNILLGEVDRVASYIDRSRLVEQIHLGGGTPTYLDCGQLESLVGAIHKNFSISKNAEISIEIDPRVTTDAQLTTLRKLGFNRTSLGLQDFDAEVQDASGRIQTENETRHAIETCRALGFSSVNVDLVYGLPRQTPEKFQSTLKKVLSLNPDRIALFNFAYVPWLHAHQRKISEGDLPGGWTKLEMFCTAIDIFQNAGYDFIGLDHFAKQGDELLKARREGTMYRNFQGYTTKAQCDMLAFGVTAIGYVDGAFVQNAKKLKDYEDAISQKGWATCHGMKLSGDDLKRQWVIREIFCHQKIDKKKFDGDFDLYFEKEIKSLEVLEQDGIVALGRDQITITPLGRFFLRNVGMVFDAYFKEGQKKFSKII